jgi:hypothetical protein
MPGTWLSWALIDMLGYVRVQGPKGFTYGMQLASQRIALSGRPDASATLTPTTYSSVKLALPAFRFTGRADHKHVLATLNIDYFRLMLKPQLVDDILVVQQKFGSDFNEIVDVVAANKPKRSLPARSSLSFDVAVKLEGFKIGIQGPTTTQYLETPSISAKYGDGSRGPQWHVSVTGLGLSLVHDVPTHDPDELQYPAAHMTMDFELHNSSPSDSEVDTEYLTFYVARIHALMMPASISELGDLVDHVQVRFH